MILTQLMMLCDSCVELKKQSICFPKNCLLISGKIVPKKDVAEIIQRFNIQVNNLTQVSVSLYLEMGE